MASGLVSILIPAYNAEWWVTHTIKSALAQNWPRTEVVVVDDGSADNTVAAARRFESRRVKVVSQERLGAAAARNRALSLAQGDFIQWLDADDLLAPDKLSRQLEASESGAPLVLLSSAFGSFFLRPERAVFAPSLLWQDFSPVDWIATKFANNLWMNPAVWLVSRQLTDAAGRWNESLSLDDDGEYFCRVIAASDNVKFIRSAKSYYRQWNTASLSRAASYNACRSLLTSLKLSVGYLLSLEDSRRTRNAALSYLQVWMVYFYPEKQDLLEDLHSFAATLGGQLQPPTLTLKYDLIRRTLGWRRAKTAMRVVAAAHLRARTQWDRVMVAPAKRK
jgi:glycosyltransferase involved in cell wall biosynthesis